jgi:hypothetical protein
MAELEYALRTIGQNVDYPATPDVAGRVRRRLAEGERPRRTLVSRRAFVIALAVLAVSVGAVLAVPPARSTVFDWLGIGNVTIRYVEELPPVSKATPDLGLGERVSLAEARRLAGYRIRVPAVDGLDEPPKVYYRDDAARQVAFLYGSEDEPKLLITQANAGGAVQKLVGAGTEVELVVVEPGTAGAWLSGAKHNLFYPGGEADGEEPFRLVGNALVFETPASTTVRIEAEISKAEAIRIARSMR